MKIKAVPCKGKDLKPGDLFSDLRPSYWEEYESFHAIGEKVYIRTNAPHNTYEGETDIYKIIIDKGDAE